MKPKMANFGVVLLLALAAVLAGCVERELFIRSDPPGALVFVDGIPRGETPLEQTFESYGTRAIEVRLQGYKAACATLEVDPPWYQILPLDFFCEVLIPYTWVDSHSFDVRLEKLDPEELDAVEDVTERAGELRRDS